LKSAKRQRRGMDCRSDCLISNVLGKGRNKLGSYRKDELKVDSEKGDRLLEKELEKTLKGRAGEWKQKRAARPEFSTPPSETGAWTWRGGFIGARLFFSLWQGRRPGEEENIKCRKKGGCALMMLVALMRMEEGGAEKGKEV